MKPYKILLFAFLVASTITVFAQTSKPIKLYAYSMLTTGGAAQVDENGQQINKNRPQYLIYYETTSKTKPTLDKIWVKGILYNISVLEIKTLPVISYNENKKTVLVPKTNKKVWQILLLEPINVATKKMVTPKEVKTNEVVLATTTGSQKHVVKIIKELPNQIAP